MSAYIPPSTIVYIIMIVKSRLNLNIYILFKKSLNQLRKQLAFFCILFVSTTKKFGFQKHKLDDSLLIERALDKELRRYLEKE